MTEQVLEVEELSEDKLSDYIPCEIRWTIAPLAETRCSSPSAFRVRASCCPDARPTFLCRPCFDLLVAGAITCITCGATVNVWRMM